jgi:hypothetical protein
MVMAMIVSLQHQTGVRRLEFSWRYVHHQMVMVLEKVVSFRYQHVRQMGTGMEKKILSFRRR